MALDDDVNQFDAAIHDEGRALLVSDPVALREEHFEQFAIVSRQFEEHARQVLRLAQLSLVNGGTTTE